MVYFGMNLTGMENPSLQTFVIHYGTLMDIMKFSPVEAAVLSSLNVKVHYKRRGPGHE